MKSIVHGKMYNTDTAREISCWENHCFSADRDWVQDTLYCKRNGEYFLVRLFHPDPEELLNLPDDEIKGLDFRIRPLSVPEAKLWVEKCCDVDVYISEFGEPEE